MKKQQAEERQPNGWIRAGAIITLFALLGICVGGWMLRKPIAHHVLTSWCLDQGVRCEARISELSFSRIGLEDVQVHSQGEVPLAIQSVFVQLAWEGLLRPQLNGIFLQAPVIRAVIVESEPTLYGLEKVVEALGNNGDSQPSDAPLPLLDVQDGKLFVETDAGTVSAGFLVESLLNQTRQASLHIAPVDLQNGDMRVSLSQGDISLTYQDGTLIGTLDLAIEAAALEAVTIENVAFVGSVSNEKKKIDFDLAGQAGELRVQGQGAKDLGIHLQGSFAHLPEEEWQSLPGLLDSVMLVLSGDDVKLEDVEAIHGALNLELARQGERLTGPVSVELKDVGSIYGAAEELALLGDVSTAFTEIADLTYEGSFAVRQASIDVSLRDQLLQAVALPEPVSAFGDAVRRDADAALSSFETGSDLKVSFVGGNWSIEVRRPSLFVSQSGVSFSIDPFLGQPWLRANQRSVLVAGDINLQGGGGLPFVSAGLDALTFDERGISIRAREVMLDDWSSANQKLFAQIASFEMELFERMRVIADGLIGFSGVLPGLVLNETQIVGQINAVQAEEGWRVQTRNGSCMDVMSKGLAAGSVKFAAFDLALCPVDGRFVRQENGASVGRISLGNLDLPFSTEDSDGTLQMRKTAVEWYADDGIRLFVTGDRLSLPLSFQEETLLIDGKIAELVVALSKGPPQISSAIGETTFSGTLVPAKVISDSFSFEGQAVESGLNGEMLARAVRIYDLADDPLYQPIIATLSARLTDGMVEMSGPIRGIAKNNLIADASLNLDLGSFDGAARIDLVPIEFRVGGLQPVDLSELLRGVLINAVGNVEGSANFAIQQGALSGTGYVDLQNVVFDTLSVGTITGVNGRIYFSDMLALTTPPGQRLTIDYLDPGLPLADGVLGFQLINGAEIRIERARWPFAGGTLEVLPATWMLGSSAGQVIVAAKELTLASLVEVFNVPDLVAEGTASGQFPVEVDGADIWVRNATLQVDEKGGMLSYTGSATDFVKGKNTFADFAIEALKDFSFTVLELGIDGNLIGNMIVDFSILGTNQDVMDSAEFQLNFRLDSNLSQLLRTFSQNISETYIIEALEQQKSDGTRPLDP